MRHINKIYVFISIIILIILLCYPTYRVIKTNILPFQSKTITCSLDTETRINYAPNDWYSEEYPRPKFPKNFSITFNLYSSYIIEGSSIIRPHHPTSYKVTKYGDYYTYVPLYNSIGDGYNILYTHTFDDKFTAWIMYRAFDYSNGGEYDAYYSCDKSYI